MIVTVLKTTFPKNKPNVLVYRDFSKFVKEHFREALRAELQKTKVISYEPFENLYLMVLNIHAPVKKKISRANHKPCLETTKENYNEMF